MSDWQLIRYLKSPTVWGVFIVVYYARPWNNTGNSGEDITHMHVIDTFCLFIVFILDCEVIRFKCSPWDCALNNTKAVKIKLILNTGCQKSTRGLLNVLMDPQSSYMMMGLSNCLYSSDNLYHVTDPFIRIRSFKMI